MSDRHRLAWHVRRAELARLQAEAVARALLESPDRMHPRAARSPAGDERRLRGIPAIGRGVSGHIPGTQPEQEALRSGADGTGAR